MDGASQSNVCCCEKPGTLLLKGQWEINNKLLILRKIGLFERNTKYETFFIDPHHVMNICSSYGDPTKIFAMNGVHFRKCSYNAFKKGSMFPQHVSPSKIGENLNY